MNISKLDCNKPLKNLMKAIQEDVECWKGTANQVELLIKQINFTPIKEAASLDIDNPKTVIYNHISTSEPCCLMIDFPKILKQTTASVKSFMSSKSKDQKAVKITATLLNDERQLRVYTYVKHQNEEFSRK